VIGPCLGRNLPNADTAAEAPGTRGTLRAPLRVPRLLHRARPDPRVPVRSLGRFGRGRLAYVHERRLAAQSTGSAARSLHRVRARIRRLHHPGDGRWAEGHDGRIVVFNAFTVGNNWPLGATLGITILVTELLDRGARLVFESHAARGMTLVMPRRRLCRDGVEGRGETG
jgi:hypothetical protein